MSWFTVDLLPEKNAAICIENHGQPRLISLKEGRRIIAELIEQDYIREPLYNENLIDQLFIMRKEA